MTEYPPQPGQPPFGQQPSPTGMPAAPPPPGYAPFASKPPTPPQGLSAAKMAGIVIGVVVGVFALAGLIFGVTRGGADDAAVTTSPDVPTSVVPTPEPPLTDAPSGTTPETVPADSSIGDEPSNSDPSTTDDTATDTTPDTTPDTAVEAPPTSEDVQLTEIGQLIAWTSFSEEPLDAATERAEIDQLLVTRTVEATAHPTAVTTLCAGIPMDAPIDLSVVWQLDGSTVQADPVSASPPGVGTCLSNDGGPLAAGAYQVFASNDDESDVGFVTTFVIGATEVNQSFVNNTDFEICDLGVAPLTTAYYEFFTSTDGPIRPGELINIDVASVQQDLRVRTCAGEDLENLTFSPNASTDQPMNS